MKIRIAENAGFCYGVKRAIKIADEALKKNEIIYSLGPIIHNPQVVGEYEKKGLKVVETIDEAKNAVLIRSHGIPPQVYEQISEKNLECIDATCPFVKEAQDYAKQLYEEGYFVVIVGDQNHPEVKAHIAYANYKAQVINSIQEAKNIEAQKIGVISQTTQSVDNFVSIVSELVKKAKEIRIFNTICDATEKRQESAKELAKNSDLMIVIGGKNSANTRKLYEICLNFCKKVYHIETKEELKKEWFEGVENVGITAGASTPSWLIEDVIKAIEKIENDIY
ncbi:MAG: 4-hydroxy-3-methylbut-2-enyl diphosphate reductase [Desulfurella sp.]|uniref:4-hydroxy-3-methylbut-2-enyl diphosphate reductase n=1 Tax=Desulfurella sp. TaxID=1962857 RepID=UPI003D0B88CF